MKVAFSCPSCGNVFIRSVGKLTGKTSCPKCKGLFARGGGAADPETASWAFEARKERKLSLRETTLAKVSPMTRLATIRGKQIPTSEAETKFKARAIEKGWKPHRPSWPDFLVETDEGLIGVEVKSRRDTVSPTQELTFALLENAGIRVFIWKDSKEERGKLVRWRKTFV